MCYTTTSGERGGREERGREGGRKGGREGGREGGKEEGREGGRKGGRERERGGPGLHTWFVQISLLPPTAGLPRSLRMACRNNYRRQSSFKLTYQLFYTFCGHI